MKMKKLIVLALVFAGFVACKKTETVTTGVDTVKVDTTVVDSVSVDSAVVDSAKK